MSQSSLRMPPGPRSDLIDASLYRSSPTMFIIQIDQIVPCKFRELPLTINIIT
jgi:hypothetical protein